MQKLELYKELFNSEYTFKDVLTLFKKNLTNTNKSYSFFTDFEKVKKYINKYNVEIHLLNSLITSDNPRADFKKLIKNYPNVIKVLPLMVANRVKPNEIIYIVDEFKNECLEDNYVFNDKDISDEKIEELLKFLINTGFFELIEKREIKSIHDYYFGVEVGMDTNARKNRSGVAMELATLPYIENLAKKYNLTMYSQLQFKKIKEVDVPKRLENRKFDYVLLNDKIRINIEVNYYNGGGSKPQEIIDSYINRQVELKSCGWDFIQLTDGQGWAKCQNQEVIGMEQLDCLSNMFFMKHKVIDNFIEQRLKEV